MGPCGCCARGCGLGLKALAIALTCGLIGVAHSRFSPLPLDVPRPEAIDSVLSRLDSPAAKTTEDQAVADRAASPRTDSAKEPDKAPAKPLGDTVAPGLGTPSPAAPPPAPSPTPPAASGQGDTLMITLEQAQTLHARVTSAGDVAFVDARNAEEFVQGRIPGATNVPPSAFFGGAIPAELDMIPRSNIVVVYCGGGQCDASKLTATRLREQGYEKVYVFEQGMTGWKAANLPIEK